MQGYGLFPNEEIFMIKIQMKAKLLGETVDGTSTNTLGSNEHDLIFVVCFTLFQLKIFICIFHWLRGKYVDYPICTSI